VKTSARVGLLAFVELVGFCAIGYSLSFGIAALRSQ
jgi:hypothetical protein